MFDVFYQMVMQHRMQARTGDEQLSQQTFVSCTTSADQTVLHIDSRCFEYIEYLPGRSKIRSLQRHQWKQPLEIKRISRDKALRSNNQTSVRPSRDGSPCSDQQSLLYLVSNDSIIVCLVTDVLIVFGCVESTSSRSLDFAAMQEAQSRQQRVFFLCAPGDAESEGRCRCRKGFRGHQIATGSPKLGCTENAWFLLIFCFRLLHRT